MYDRGGGSGVEKVTGARGGKLKFCDHPPKKNMIMKYLVLVMLYVYDLIPSPYRSCIIIQDLKGEGGHFLHLWKIDTTE